MSDANQKMQELIELLQIESLQRNGPTYLLGFLLGSATGAFIKAGVTREQFLEQAQAVWDVAAASRAQWDLEYAPPPEKEPAS
jgi:hypothetical protein